MLDYQRIVDDVLNSLYMSASEGVDSLRAVASEYRQACEEANDRLRRAGKLLRQGLRSEAIQLAEIEPTLLDVVGLLESVDRQAWSSLLAQHGLASPAPLAIDLATQLKDAYAQEQPLVGLLDQHRLLALARSPLAPRIRVLRQLADLDRQNPVWREDLSAYEHERQRQLHKEVTQASEANDLAALATFVDELRGDPWLEPPPAGLLSRANDARARLTRQSARSELERLAGPLAAALAALDLPAGRRLRERWQSLISAAGLTPAEPLASRAAPALDWLAQQDQLEAAEATQQRARAALEQALAGRAGRGELESLYAVVTAEGRTLSPELEREYQDRLAALGRAAARHRRWVAAGTLLVAGLVVTGGIAASRYVSYRRDVAAQAAALEKLLAAGQLEEAQQFADQLATGHPELAHDPRLADLLLQLADLKQKEADRRQAFQAALGAIVAAGTDKPNQAMLKRARDLVRTESERTELAALEGRIAAAQGQSIEQQEVRFRKTLAELNHRFAELESKSAAPVAEQEALQALDRDVATLVAETPDDVRGQLQDDLNPLAAQLAARRTQVRRQLDESAQEAAITRSVGDVEAFRRAVQSYVDRFGDADKTVGFRRSLADAPLWSEIDDWNELVSKWESTASGPLDAARAGELATALKAFCAKHPRWPGAAALQARTAALEAVARRQQDGQSLAAGLERIFGDPLMADVWLVELRDHKRYYARLAPETTAAGLTRFKYVAGFDLSEKSRNVRSNEVLPVRRAPQVALSQAALQILGKLNDENWDASFRKLLEEIWRSDAKGPRIDPLLKLKLLQQTVEAATKGSYVLEGELAQQLKLLRGSKVSPIANWLEPDDAEANASREQAVRELDVLAKQTPDTKLGKERAAAAHAPLGKKFEWIGWLRRDSDGRWQCVGNMPLDKSGKLYLLTGGMDAQTLHVVGHLTPQGAEITATGAMLAEGRPIYVLPHAAEPGG